MFTRKDIQLLFVILASFGFSLFFSACDRNIAEAPDPSASAIVSIDSFTVDNDTITEGEIVKLSWAVTGEYSKILILPDIGEVPAEDSLLIKPDHTITYTLQVFAIPGDDGAEDLGRIDQIKVTVNAAEDEVDPAADEVVIPESGIDDLVDETGTDEEPEVVAGDDDPDSEPSPDAEEEPIETAHIVSFAADETQVLWGEPLTISWEAEMTATAPLLTLNGETVSPISQTSLTAGLDGKSWTLSLTTPEGVLVDTQSVSVTATAFSSLENFEDFGSLKVSAFLPVSKTECWFASDESEIFYSEDGLATVTRETNDGIAGDIRSLAIDGDSLLYVGTTQGLYYRRLSDAQFTMIGDTAGQNTITAILPRAGDKNLLIGSEKALFEAYAVENTSDCPYDNTAGYCIVIKDFLTASPNVYRLLVDPNHSERIIILTDSGVYESEDSGGSFRKLTSLSSGLRDGTWDHNGGFLWGDTAVAEWNDEDETFESIIDLPDLIGAISSVIRMNDYLFVADASGIQADLGNGWFATGFDSKANFFWGSQQAGFLSASQLHVFTGEGRHADLTWSNQYRFFRDFGFLFPVTLEAVWQSR
jgi:hypothetical protein